MRQISTAQPLTVAAYEALRESICTGALAPGERLIQTELAARLGVSRLPVHEALRQLRQEGFAIETGRRGLVVSPLDADFLLQLFEFRAALDRTAGRSAARARRPPDETRGQTIVERGRKGLSSHNLLAVAGADHDFHALIYQIGGNPLIAAAAERNWHHVRRAFLTLIESKPELILFWEDHTAILAAVMAGDEDRAGKLCWDHSIRSGLSYSAVLRSRAEAQADPPLLASRARRTG